MMQRLMKYVVIAVGGIVAASILLAIAAIAFLQSRAGASFTESQIARLTDNQIIVQGLEWHGLSQLSLATLHIYQSTGSDDVLASAKGADLRVDWPSLLGRSLTLHHITAEQLTVHAPDGGAPSNAPPQPPALSLPSLPVSVSLQSLRIEQLVFVAQAFGLEGHYRIGGHAHINRDWQQADVALTMQRLNGNGGLDLNLLYGQTQPAPRAHIHFHDADGAPIAALTGFDGGAVTLQLNLLPHGADYLLTLAADMAKGPVLDGDFQISATAEHADGQLGIDLTRMNLPGITKYSGNNPLLHLTVDALAGGDIKLRAATNLRAPDLSTNAALQLVVLRSTLFRTNKVDWNASLGELSSTALPNGMHPVNITAHGSLDESLLLGVGKMQIKAGQSELVLSGHIPLADYWLAKLSGKLKVTDASNLVPDINGDLALDFTIKPVANQAQALRLVANGPLHLAFSENQNLALIMRADATFDAQQNLQASLAATAKSLAGLMPTLQGQASANIGLNVNTTDIQFKARLDGTHLQYADMPETQITMLMDGTAPLGSPEQVIAAVQVNAGSGPMQASLASQIRSDGTIVQLDKIALTAPPLSGGGQLSYNLQSGLISGDVAIKGQQLSGLQQWPLPLEAKQAITDISGTIEVALRARQRLVSVTGTIEGLNAPSFGLAVPQSAFTAQFDQLQPTHAPTASLTAANIRYGNVELTDTDLTIEPRAGLLHVQLNTAANQPVQSAVSLAAEVDLREQTSVTLTGLSGTFEAQPFALINTSTLLVQDQKLSLSPMRLRLGEGELALSYRHDQAQISASAQITDMALTGLVGSYLGEAIPTHLSGTAQLAGPKSGPSVMLDLALTSTHDSFEYPLNIVLTGQNNGPALAFDITVSGIEQSAKMTATGQLPLLFDAASGIPLPDLPSPIQINLQGALGLAPFSYMVFDDGSRLDGQVLLDAAIGGTGNAPQITGSACLKGAGARLVSSGAALENANGCIKLAGDGTFTGAIKAGNKQQGSMSLDMEGALAHAAIKGKLGSDALLVLDGDIGQMRVSSAVLFDVKLQPEPTGQIAGKITVNDADLVIPSGSSQPFAVLNVTHVNQPGAAAPTPQPDAQVSAQQNGQFGTKLALDLHINVPGQFFVRGRGIESEWKGGVHLTGTAAHPTADGLIELVKGNASTGAANLRFTEGQVQIVPGTQQAMPGLFLNMISESQVEGATARMQISGPISQPLIAFSAQPPLPEDEILARLLFGKPAAQLTTSESLSLGVAALELSGAFGSGAGFVDKLRRSLGIDRLSFEASADSPQQSSLSAGKYVRPDLYISVHQGADGSTPGVSVEYELNKNITVTGEQKGDAGEKVGIEYRIDY